MEMLTKKYRELRKQYLAVERHFEPDDRIVLFWRVHSREKYSAYMATVCWTDYKEVKVEYDDGSTQEIPYSDFQALVAGRGGDKLMPDPLPDDELFNWVHDEPSGWVFRVGQHKMV